MSISTRADDFKIPVFVSCPTNIFPKQKKSVKIIEDLLVKSNLEPITPGDGHYSFESPINMVLGFIQKCHGGIILGFERIPKRNKGLIIETSTRNETNALVIVSPWHQIEASMLFARNLPIMICKEKNVQGGIFDSGTSDCMLHEIPLPNQPIVDFEIPFLKWVDEVHRHYEISISKFDVFLSFSGEDELPARKIFEFLTMKGLRVFFSRETISKLRQAEYMKAINNAVDKARHMIIVSSSAHGFAKPWVEREWMMFLNEKLSGRKSGNIIVVQDKTIPVASLPIALRSQQVISLSNVGLNEMYEFVLPND
jgi:hypothetical protein